MTSLILVTIRRLVVRRRATGPNSRYHSAVDQEVDAGNKQRLGGKQERGSSRYLVRCAESPRGRSRHQAAYALPMGESSSRWHWCGDRAGN